MLQWYMCSDRMNWGIYFGYCYGDGDYRLYAKQVADSGPGRLATARCRRRRLPPDSLTCILGDRRSLNIR